jgi:hypothetical protein
MIIPANEKLKPEIFEITTGLLLGDGNLQKPSGCKYYRLRFAQNSVRQDYVIHLFKKYQHGLQTNDFVSIKPLINQIEPRLYLYKTKINKLNKKSYSFETRLSSAFNEHATFFYFNQSSKKNLCTNLDIFYDILTPKALAYWYMDDGTWPNKKSKSFQLCTHGYTLQQVIYLSNLLNTKFKLITTIGFNKKQPIIRISAKSYNIFKNLIYNTLVQIPSMQVKFPLKKLEDIV